MTVATATRHPGLLGPTGAWVGQFWGKSADEARNAARRLEAAGYSSLWVSEALGREVLAFAGVLLAATDRLVLATGIANIWVRDAVAMANGARTLAEAFPGRFVLGVGVSHAPLIDRRGHDYGRPLAMMREYLDAMAAAEYRAVAPRTPPPLLVGALGDRMLDLAAQSADGAHPYLVTPQHTAGARRIMGPTSLLAPEQSVVVCSDPGPARTAARTHLATYLRLDNYVRSLQRQGFAEEDLRNGGSDHLVDELVAWGDVDAVLARIIAHRDAGADHVALHPLPGQDVPDPVDQLAMLAAAGAASVTATT